MCIRDSSYTAHNFQLKASIKIGVSSNLETVYPNDCQCYQTLHNKFAWSSNSFSLMALLLQIGFAEKHLQSHHRRVAILCRVSAVFFRQYKMSLAWFWRILNSMSVCENILSKVIRKNTNLKSSNTCLLYTSRCV